MAAAFVRPLSLCPVAEKVLERFEEEGAEPAAVFIRVLKPVAFQNHGEEILGQILRILDGMPLSSDETENRTPVKPAKLCQCFARFLFIAGGVWRGKNEAPSSCGKHQVHSKRRLVTFFVFQV